MCQGTQFKCYLLLHCCIDCITRAIDMKAIEITTPGGPDVLKLCDVPAPEVKAGELLIRVVATALNRADCMQRQGKYPPPPGSSLIPGLECSGIIQAIGEGVSGWKIGDQVCALLTGGGYAELVAVPAVQVLPVPKGLSLVEAASLPEVTCTVWSTVFMTAGLKAGETLLVQGGSSGIGTFAIQIAKAKGARVFCTAGSEEKLAACRELGAEVAINYRTEDFVARVKEATGGKGVDVILDNVGAKYLSQNLDALAVGGRLFIIGLMGGAVTEMNLGTILMKRLTISAAGLRSRSVHNKGEIVGEVKAYVWPEVESGKVRPVVHNVLPLKDAAKGHALMEESTHIGKIVLQVSS